MRKTLLTSRPMIPRSEMTFLASELVRMRVMRVRRWTEALAASSFSSPFPTGRTSFD